MKGNVCLKWLELGDQESGKEEKVPRSQIQDALRDPIRDDQSIRVSSDSLGASTTYSVDAQ